MYISSDPFLFLFDVVYIVVWKLFALVGIFTFVVLAFKFSVVTIPVCIDIGVCYYYCSLYTFLLQVLTPSLFPHL